MVDHWLLMSGPMVRAQLIGAKTYTRRTSDYWARAKVGDGLWIREAFCRLGSGELVYRADYDRANEDPSFEPKWTPSLLMPRSVCRLEYRLASIRQEPIQEITEEDAVAEGMLTVTVDDLVELARGSRRKLGIGTRGTSERLFRDAWNGVSARDRFRVVFELLNGPEAWERNELVWVLGMEGK